MTEWEKDKRWSDRFLPEIKRVLGECLIVAAPLEEDQERNTDLIVLKLEAIRIGCRVRKWKYLERYGNQFTLRAERVSGNRTELAKIVAGWGKFLFYGFSDELEQTLAQWKLISLDEFRVWFNGQIVINQGRIPGEIRHNQDGSSSLRAFDIGCMPRSVIFAQS